MTARALQEAAGLRPKTASAYNALSSLGSPTAKIVGDVAGLGMLAGTTIDRAVGGDDPARESIRSLGDTLGYASIGVPIAAGLLSKGKAKLDMGDAVALGSIGALALPALDNLQANARSAAGPVWRPTSDYQILPHKAHAALELAGMGVLGAQSAKALATPGAGSVARAGAATELAGYGALMAPYAADLASEDGHGSWQDTRRALSDTAGLGLLAAGAIAGHRAH